MTTDTSAASTVAHATFVVERTFDAPLDRVWDAFAVPEQHAQWFGSDPGFTETEASEEFRVGGQAVQDGQWHDGPTSRYVATYTDIVEQARIVSTYDMWVGGTHLSTSLTTTELTARLTTRIAVLRMTCSSMVLQAQRAALSRD